MRFAHGRAVFRSRYREERTWAGGVPHRLMVAEGSIVKLHPVSFPEVKFVNHYYQTEDQAIAEALIKDTNFERSWGWWIDPMCLTTEARGIYSSLTIDAKRELALRLVDGMAGSKAMLEMQKAGTLTQGVDPPEDGSGVPHRIKCPGTNCLAVFEATGPDKLRLCIEALNTHLAKDHPDYDNRKA